MIDRQRWLALQPLLDQVLDIAPAERRRWLDALSVESPGLAEDLASLLAGEAAAERTGFLDRPLDVTLAGLEFGAYRLERPLGQGGMGTVWLRRRADGRFEGSVLARLAHPGIARLLDAGLSGGGQPYWCWSMSKVSRSMNLQIGTNFR